jgi:predicted Fe-Mo cluster-binding NifX family protein
LIKIAAVSDDGSTISAHFGRATHYVVVTVDGGQVIGRETREKMGHGQFHHEEHGSLGTGHGFDPASQIRHTSMIEAVTDCQVLIARGMGGGAYASIKQAGITPILTDIGTIEAAIQAYLQGKLADHPEKLH